MKASEKLSRILCAFTVYCMCFATGSQHTEATIIPSGSIGDERTSLVYSSLSGELKLDAPASNNLTSINISSADGVFLGPMPEVLTGAFDNFAPQNIFKATFGDNFSSLSFGEVMEPGLEEGFLLSDLSVVGSTAKAVNGSPELGDVDLVYIGGSTLFNASFHDDRKEDRLAIDFGEVIFGQVTAPHSFQLTNLTGVGSISSTADMDLVQVEQSGDSSTLSVDVAPFSKLAPGDSRVFSAHFDTLNIGEFESDIELLLANSTDTNDQKLLRVQLSGTVVEPPDGVLIQSQVTTDAFPSLIYNPDTGELSVASSHPLTSFGVVSKSGIFSGQIQVDALSGDFDVQNEHDLFKATFGESFDRIDFGPVIPQGLSVDFLLADLEVVGTKEGGGTFDNAFLVNGLPEPSTAALAVLAIIWVSIKRFRAGKRRVALPSMTRCWWRGVPTILDP